MSRILIFYRREDSADVTGRIYDRLIQQFGRGTVFKDVDSMAFGVDFRVHLDTQLAKCEVFLAVIGRDWMKKRGSKSKSRLDDPGDFVRIEVESALKRQILVIPVLVSGAAIPPADRLPDSLRDLSYRNGLVVRPDPDFHRDLDRLIEFLKQKIKGPDDQRTEPSLTGETAAEALKEGPAPTPEEKSAPALEEKPGPGLEEKPTRAPEEKPSPRPVEAEQPTSRQSSIRSSEKPRQEPPLEMVKVPKGPFLYGDEKTREVTDYNYWIDQYPVTNEKYRVFVSADGYGNQAYWSPEGWKWKTENDITGPEFWDDPQWNKADCPVVGVSYYEAEAYAKCVGKRLPTDQEWEKAARGEDGRQYPWGEEFDKNRCNSGESGIGHTTPVTQYPNGVSPWGCYDMVGNVWEWCADWYDETNYRRVIRGGSWFSKPGILRASNRYRGIAVNRFSHIGFRLVQNMEL